MLCLHGDHFIQVNYCQSKSRFIKHSLIIVTVPNFLFKVLLLKCKVHIFTFLNKIVRALYSEMASFKCQVNLFHGQLHLILNEI